MALLNFERTKACVALTSRFAFDEAQRNVRVKYPGSLKALESLLDTVATTKEPSAALFNWATEHLPTKDAPILAAAVASRAQVLVTGDRKHFGKLVGQTFKSVVVLPPRLALERLL